MWGGPPRSRWCGCRQEFCAASRPSRSWSPLRLKCACSGWTAIPGCSRPTRTARSGAGSCPTSTIFGLRCSAWDAASSQPTWPSARTGCGESSKSATARSVICTRRAVGASWPLYWSVRSTRGSRPALSSPRPVWPRSFVMPRWQITGCADPAGRTEPERREPSVPRAGGERRRQHRCAIGRPSHRRPARAWPERAARPRVLALVEAAGILAADERGSSSGPPGRPAPPGRPVTVPLPPRSQSRKKHWPKGRRWPRELPSLTYAQLSAPVLAASGARAGVRERAAGHRRSPSPHRSANRPSSPNEPARCPRWTAR